MKRVYEIGDLDKLEEFLSVQDKGKIREELFAEFLKYSDYKNVSDWNKAVRLCESLSIVGWGDREPVQAVRGVFFNGSPTTCFYNKFREPRFVDAIWSKRKDGFTMEQGRTAYNWSPDVPQKQSSGEYPVIEDIQDLSLEKQRNWIARNPILITRGISNCYKESEEVIESIYTDLQNALDSKMRSELYGNTIDRIIVNCSFSYFDHDSCKTNHIIADEKLKLKQKDFYPQLLKMYSKKEIEENGYYLRNRYDYGSFRNGKIKTTIHFEKDLGQKSYTDQKREIAKYIEIVVETIVEKLKKKKLVYNFDLMQEHFLNIISDWKEKPVSKS